jgi:hypothetical protein
MFHRRRLTILQYMLLGIFFGSSVYLWTNRIGITRPFNAVLLQDENLLQVGLFHFDKIHLIIITRFIGGLCIGIRGKWRR